MSNSKHLHLFFVGSTFCPALSQLPLRVAFYGAIANFCLTIGIMLLGFCSSNSFVFCSNGFSCTKVGCTKRLILAKFHKRPNFGFTFFTKLPLMSRWRTLSKALCLISHCRRWPPRWKGSVNELLEFPPPPPTPERDDWVIWVTDRTRSQSITENLKLIRKFECKGTRSAFKITYLQLCFH